MRFLTKVTITDIFDGNESTPYSGDAQREIMKYRASETFSSILDDLYETHRQDMADIRAYSVSVRLIEVIEKYILICKDDKEQMSKLLNVITINQNIIKDLNPKSFICLFTPEQVIENFDKIKEVYS